MADRIVVGSGRPQVEELHHRSDLVYICLIVNRKQRSARIVDFLAGNFPQKQAAIQSIAVKEGIERVYTLVEREESSGWAKAGYAREGSIPGYYKRSDAYLLGHLIHTPPLVTPEGMPIPPVADLQRAEKALNAAKKLKELQVPKSVRATLINDDELATLKAAQKGKKNGVLHDERFGRTGSRLHVAARDGKSATREQVVSAEVQECFGNAYLHLASTPTNENEAKLLVAALTGLVEQLRAREVASTFLYAPVEDINTNVAMLAAGFRKTGLLAKHLIVGDRRTDAILWTRKTGSSAADADAA